MNCQKIRAAIETTSRREPLSEGARRHLSGCDGCREYADELGALFALLNAAPRVTVPGDFDFRLRARISAAQAERQSPFSLLKGFWSLPFSLGQAATTMAAIALLASVATFYFVHDKSPQPSGTIAANVTQNPVAEPQTVGPQKPRAIEGPSLPSHPGIRVNFSRGGIRVPRPHPANIESIPATTVSESSEIAMGTKIIIKSPRGGAVREMTVPEVTYGAQPAVARSEKLPENTVAIF